MDVPRSDGGKVMKRLITVVLCAVCLTLCATSYSAHAGYPDHYISIIVTYAAGGGYDIQARILAPYLKKYMPGNVDFVVRNIAGASGRVGAVELVKSKPDGYTIALLNAEPLAIAQLMGQSSGIDITKNITWLGRCEQSGRIVIMSKNGRIKSMEEMKGKQVRTMVTDNPPGIVMLIKSFGGEPFIMQASGSVELSTALMRGDIDVYFVSFTTGLKEVANSGGKLMPVLTLRTDKRPEVPDVPNLVDVGLQSKASMWRAGRLLAAPAGLPQDVQKMLTGTIAKATTDPDFIAKMEKAGYMPAAANPEEIKESVEDMLKTFRETQKQWEPMLSK